MHQPEVQRWTVACISSLTTACHSNMPLHYRFPRVPILRQVNKPREKKILNSLNIDLCFQIASTFSCFEQRPSKVNGVTVSLGTYNSHVSALPGVCTLYLYSQRNPPAISGTCTSFLLPQASDATQFTSARPDHRPNTQPPPLCSALPHLLMRLLNYRLTSLLEISPPPSCSHLTIPTHPLLYIHSFIILCIGEFALTVPHRFINCIRAIFSFCIPLSLFLFLPPQAVCWYNRLLSNLFLCESDIVCPEHHIFLHGFAPGLK